MSTSVISHFIKTSLLVTFCQCNADNYSAVGEPLTDAQCQTPVYIQYSDNHGCLCDAFLGDPLHIQWMKVPCYNKDIDMQKCLNACSYVV